MGLRISKPIFLLLFLLLSAFQQPTPLEQLPRARVVAVKDGDTIEILTSDKFSITVRLDEIDCPEKKQAFGEKARKFTADFCFGKFVRIKSRGKDGFGRLLAEVFNEKGESLNKALIKNGLAWKYLRYSRSDELARLEDAAKKSKIGLWADKLPIPPWEFRSMKVKPAASGKAGG